MSNIKVRLTSTLLILSLVVTMFAITTIPAHAATKKITLKASASGQTQAVLTWNKISKPYSGYAVFRDGKVIKYFGKGTKKFVDSGLASGSAHSYQIKSYKKTKQYYNTKTKKWVTKKPKSKYWKGKQTRYVYSYKTKSNVVTIRTAYAYFNITFKNWNGTVLKTQTCIQGSTPSCPTPSRPADNDYTYTFTGWSPSITTAWANKTYTAQYKAVAKPIYTVTFKNYNGTILQTVRVKAGTVPSYTGSNPTRPEDSDNTYTFKGWSPNISAVTGNTTYTAQFNTIPKPVYSITWNNWNGTTLKTDAVKQGVTPQYTGTTPKRLTTETATYEFVGWSPTIEVANSNKTYTAVFREIPRYKIEWLNWDNSVLRTDYVKPGVKPMYPGTPSRPADDTYVYQFTGWDPAVVSANGNASYKAQYTPVLKNTNVTITWQDWDNNILKTETVSVGTVPSYTGAIPTKPEDDAGVYEFNGWSPSPAAVTQDTVYKAKLKTTPKYTVTWNNYNGETLKVEKVKKGDVPNYTGPTPTKPESDDYIYTFINWFPAPTAVTEDVTYEANFKAVAKPESGNFTYELKTLNKPYGNGGKTVIYLKTNNPNRYDYELELLNENNQVKNLNTLRSYYKGSTTSNPYKDLDVSKLAIGEELMECMPECTGNCTICVYEWSDTGKSLVKSVPIYINDYKAEEQAWRHSIIDTYTDSSMTNAEKMDAICAYINSTFKYTKVPNGASSSDIFADEPYVFLIKDVGVPFWVEERLNSSTSPQLLVEFGNDIGYSLHNCYNDYEVGSSQWLDIHYYVYSAEDNKYFEACPSFETGYVNTSNIEMFNSNSYQFWEN